MTDGGWYRCDQPIVGKYFGLIQQTLEVLQFMEVMVYSQDFIQTQATITFLGQLKTNGAGVISFPSHAV